MNLSVFLVISTIAIFVIMLFTRHYYNIAIWKIGMLAIVSTISGVIGTGVLFYIETGRWGGLSLFGTVFFSPIILSVVAIVIRVPILTVLDICAPSECIVLAILKLKCYADECCYGKIMKVFSDGTYIRFPSQLVESVTFLIIMIILMHIIHRGKHTGKIYMLYMIVYGSCRFILNWLRDTEPFIWKLPAGNFWALIAIFLGSMLLILVTRYLNKNSPIQYKNRGSGDK